MAGYAPMNNDQKRIKIAELCGWKRRPECDYTSHLDPVFHNLGARVEMWGKETGQLIPFSKIPDYLNDLNAMHAAEKTLTDFRAYTLTLIELTDGDAFTGGGAIYATAAQRADAFIAVHNKTAQPRVGNESKPTDKTQPVNPGIVCNAMVRRLIL